jgi:hypothetical protein
VSQVRATARHISQATVALLASREFGRILRAKHPVANLFEKKALCAAVAQAQFEREIVNEVFGAAKNRQGPTVTSDEESGRAVPTQLARNPVSNTIGFLAPDPWAQRLPQLGGWAQQMDPNDKTDG